VNPLGLYDLDRKIRPVGEAYRQLVQDWREVLPTQSVCLKVPVVMPQEHDSGSWRAAPAESRDSTPPTEPAVQTGRSA
jgi:hypothetical protein